MTCSCGGEFCWTCGGTWPCGTGHGNAPPVLNLSALDAADVAAIEAAVVALDAPPVIAHNRDGVDIPAGGAVAHSGAAVDIAPPPPPLPPSNEGARVCASCEPCEPCEPSSASGTAAPDASLGGRCDGRVSPRWRELRIEVARRRVVDSLTLRCPNGRCAAALHMEDDFADCFSLSCARCPRTLTTRVAPAARHPARACRSHSR